MANGQIAYENSAFHKLNDRLNLRLQKCVYLCAKTSCFQRVLRMNDTFSLDGIVAVIDRVLDRDIHACTHHSASCRIRC